MKDTFDIVTVYDGDYTITFGVFQGGGKYVPFAGASKRNHEDRMNRKRGEAIAIGRAFKNLGRTLLRQEFAVIHQNRKPEIKVGAVLPEVKQLAKKKCNTEVEKTEKKPVRKITKKKVK